MLRWRFSSGLILGLVVGLPLGAILASVFLPPAPPDTRLQFELRELTRRLEAANEARARAEKQLEEFSKLADQMTRSFENLERRFRELEAQLPAAHSQPTEAEPSPTLAPSEAGAAEPEQQ